MSVLDRLKSVLRDQDQQVIYECRWCGTPLSGEDEACPDCGRQDIAKFVL